MNSSSPTFKFRPKQQSDSMPAFFTGVGNRTVNIDLNSTLLCKSCKRTLDDDSDPEQLCSSCIINPKKKSQNEADISSTSGQSSKSKNSTINNVENPTLTSPSGRLSSTPQTFSSDGYRNFEATPHAGGGKEKSSFGQHIRSKSEPYSRKRVHENNVDGSVPDSARRRKRATLDPVGQFHAARNACMRSVQPFSNVPPFNEYDGLSGQIFQMFLENKQTDEIYAQKMALRDKLQHMIRQVYPHSALYVVGSSMTWLGAQTSDIDMCLMLTDEEVDQKNMAIGILQNVRRLFRRNRFSSFIQLIPAKVPLLKFTDKYSNIEVDLNINNADGIRNTQLLTSYARVDLRLPPLVVLVKLWARHHGINDAKNASLSSYCIVLMVIHFLQYRCDPPVLPSLQVLQPDKYDPNSNIRSLRHEEELPHFLSENYSDYGELFIGFLNYYAHEFDYKNTAMSVRLGTVLPRETVVNNPDPRNKKTDWKFLCIEEPFNCTNVARSIYKEDIFEYIKFVFDLSWKQLTRHGDLACVFA